ncbi:hypothetical protein TNCV_1408581 [Trichonephila clavipes]|uniref:Uncharacterized protein n=1 Tax=Trichonephila clavipes TaxID=2585209 RepID=A0A8X6R5W4_TRICX|nr:hypothetical protein TNCV_1408581 [Trichonephila clavipes]
MTIPKLLERVFLLEQYDEFLPEDVLTLRIESSCMSYMGLSIQKDISVEIKFLKDANVTKKDGANPSGTFMANQLERDSNELFIVIIGV